MKDPCCFTRTWWIRVSRLDFFIDRLLFNYLKLMSELFLILKCFTIVVENDHVWYLLSQENVNAITSAYNCLQPVVNYYVLYFTHDAGIVTITIYLAIISYHRGSIKYLCFPLLNKKYGYLTKRSDKLKVFFQFQTDLMKVSPAKSLCLR